MLSLQATPPVLPPFSITGVAAIGGDLNIHSAQDIASSKSSSVGGSLGLTIAPGAGLGANASFNVGSGKSNSAVVTEQTALLAKGGSLNVNVVGNTDLKGGVIAALDGQGNDSGKLNLVTGTLTASDIQDSATSKDISVGISASVNNVTDKNTRGADLPVIDGSYASSIFKQVSKATIGQGVVSVVVPDANVTFNRDIDQAQVVTKDSQTGFTVYIDPAAIKEVIALANGDKKNSVILQGVEEIGKDPLKVVKEAIKEAKSLQDGVSQSGSLETLIAQLPNLLGIKRNPTRTEAQAEFEKLAKQRTDAGTAAYEKEVGRPVTEDERAMIASIARNVAGAMVGISVKGMTDLDRLAEPLGSIPTAWSETGVDGEEVVTGDWYAMAPGDQLLSTAAKAGKWINSVDPKDREAIEKSMDVVFGGPVKAVLGWTIEYGLEKAAKENPELVGELARLANEAGIWATDKISSDDEQTVRDNNTADKSDVAAGRMPGTYIDNIFTAADLILGIDIPGVGRGKLPKDPTSTGDGGSVDHSGGLGGDGPYNSQQVQADLEAQYGRGNVQAGTLPPSNSRFPALAGTSQTLKSGETIVFDNRGFPIFDKYAQYETYVPLTPNNSGMDMRSATRDLRAAIKDGKVDPSQFKPHQLAAIKRGDAKIPDLTWHHHQESGKMQLIPTEIHRGVDHIGSVSLNKGP